MARIALLENIQDAKTAISVWLERTFMLALVADLFDRY